MPTSKDRGALERAIAGALRSAIHDHGAITPDMITSAVKRVAGNLKNVPGTGAAAELGRRRWAGVSAEERSKDAGARSKARWASMTPAERSAEMKRRRRKGLKKKATR